MKTLGDEDEKLNEDDEVNKKIASNIIQSVLVCVITYA